MIDIVNWDAGIALDSGYTYRPRPVFQSYAAYTDALAQLNKRVFSQHPPDFFIYSSHSIDRRWPGLDDSPLLPILIANYEPLHATPNGVFLRRSGRSETCQVVQSSGTALMGTWFEVQYPEEHDIVILKIHTRPTPMSVLRKLVFKDPIYELTAKRPSGKYVKYTVPRTMATIGIPISPLIRRRHELTALSSSQPSRLWQFRYDSGDTWMEVSPELTYDVESYRCRM